MKKISLFVVWTLLFNLGTILCTKYTLFIEQPDIIAPCDKYPNNFFDKVLDFSKLNRTMLPNGNINIKGYITLIQDLTELPIAMNIYVYKKVRSVWVNTIYNLERSDLCKAVADPSDFYNHLMNTLHLESLCPLKKDLVLSFDTDLEIIFDLAGPSIEGIYRADIYMTYGKDMYCTEVQLQAIIKNNK